MQYLSVKEAAKKWGYSESTIRKWCKDDIIKVTFGAEKKTDIGKYRLMHNARRKLKHNYKISGVD